MNAVTPAWAEATEIAELGTIDEYRRHVSATTTVPGLFTAESDAAGPATVRLEHTHHPNDHDVQPWYQPAIVLGIATDSMGEAMLTVDTARALAGALLTAADALERSPVALGGDAA